MKIFKVCLAVAALAGGAGPALAHHAVNAQFDVTHLVPMQGVLVSFDDLNPHCYWHFDIKGPNGAVERWNIESLAPVALRRAGLSLRDDIKAGQTYDFKIATSRNGTRTGLLIALTVNGKEVHLTPS